MAKRVAFFTVLMLHAGGVAAYAATNEQVITLPSLLMYEGMSQVVSAEYNYTGHKEKNSSSSSSNLKEHYGIASAFSVLNPHLANLAVTAGLSYNQQFGLSKSELLNYNYDVTANILDLSYHPLTLLASHGTNVVSSGYTPTYSLTTESYQLHASLLHSTVPVELFINRNSSRSSGLATETSQNGGNEQLILRHDNSVSHTTGTVSHTISQVQGSDVNGYSAMLSNSLSFDPLNNYQLGSSASFSQSKGAFTEDKDYSLEESLRCRFGQALSGGLLYRYEYSSTLSFEGVPQPTSQNTISAALRHELFQSLSTDLSVQATRSTLLGGDQQTYGSAVGLAYRKRLPADSRLNLSLTFKEEVLSQNLVSSSFTVRDESHVVAAQGEEITPKVDGQITSVFSVKSLSPIETVYLEGTDYTVDFNLGRITVVPGGGIAPGTALLISYVVDFNPSVKYLSSGQTATAQYAMMNGRYVVGGSTSSQNQKLLSGAATSRPLNDSKTYILFVNANYAKAKLGAEYSSYDSAMQSYSRVNAFWRYGTVLDDGASVSLNLNDNYTMYPSTDGSAGYAVNTSSLAGSYGRTFFDFLRFSASLAASDVRSDNGSSDFIIMRAGLSGNYNQLTFTVNGASTYRFAGSTTRVDNSLQCTVSRYF